ncbi:MAG: protein kinase family protein [Verrucomicrobia bacterium]|nr:protein kinase family protein [Verrucomicrobiota bacterium]
MAEHDPEQFRRVFSAVSQAQPMTQQDKRGSEYFQNNYSLYIPYQKKEVETSLRRGALNPIDEDELKETGTSADIAPSFPLIQRHSNPVPPAGRCSKITGLLSRCLFRKRVDNSPKISPSVLYPDQLDPFHSAGHCPKITEALFRYLCRNGYDCSNFCPIKSGSSSTIYQCGDQAFKLYKHAKKEVAPHLVWDPRQGDPLMLEQHHRNLLTPTKVLYSDTSGKISDVPSPNAVVVGVFMPYVKETLRDFLNRKGGRVGELTAAKIGLQIAKGLEGLERRCILHRDLKPENIAIQNGTVKLMDFTLAIKTNGRLLKDSINQNLYSAPEKIVLKQGYTFKSEIWALGVILFAMTSGELPFKDLFSVCLDFLDFPVDGSTSHKFERIVNNFLDKVIRRRSNAEEATAMLQKFVDQRIAALTKK